MHTLSPARFRVANRSGMAGFIPELTHGVPCPGQGSFCPGNMKIDHRADIWLFTNECIVFCIVFVSHTQRDLCLYRNLNLFL